jgi:Protein of unknown function (DUF3565)
MQRKIAGFHRDAGGYWVAELDCGHTQHIRHAPPFEMRPWVLSASERALRLGTSRDCPLCERESRRGGAPERGGEAACFAHLLCPQCGAVLDGGGHLEGCSLALGLTNL